MNCDYRDGDTGGEDEEDEGEAEQDLEPVSSGPVVPGLGVHSDLAEDVGGRGQTVLAGVENLGAVLRAPPGENQALGVGGVLGRQLRQKVGVGDVLSSSEPGPGVLAETDTGGQDELGGWEDIQGHLAGENRLFSVVVDTHNLSVRLGTPTIMATI